MDININIVLQEEYFSTGGENVWNDDFVLYNWAILASTYHYIQIW